VHHTRWDGEDFTRLDDARRLAVDAKFKLAFENIAEILAAFTRFS